MKFIIASLALCLVGLVSAADAPTAKNTLAAAPSTRVLIVGGGSSHDFNRWFNQEDLKTLGELNQVAVTYTDKPAEVAPALKDTDVLYLSSNQSFNAPGLRSGVFDHAQAGKGLLLVHPALWYNWKDWPEYNRDLVSGGARSHDKLGEFEVTVADESHPVMANVPKTFRVVDELYHFVPEEKGPARRVLATGKSPITGKEFPVAWITTHPKSRIVCLTLGHDGRAHEHPAYKAMLKNATQWVARR